MMNCSEEILIVQLLARLVYQLEYSGRSREKVEARVQSSMS